MKRTRMPLLVFAAIGVACAPHGRHPSDWDSNLARAVRAQVEQTMNAFAAMDRHGFEAGLAEDVTAFELDLENRPLRLGSRAEAAGFAENTFATVKGMGAHMALEFHATSCRAAEYVAYCTVEFDLQVALPDGSTMTQPTRNSVVLLRGAEGWKWSHWHSSLATAVPTVP